MPKIEGNEWILSETDLCEYFVNSHIQGSKFSQFSFRKAAAFSGLFVANYRRFRFESDLHRRVEAEIRTPRT